MKITDWHTALADSITDPAELLQVLALPSSLLPAAQVAADRFGLRVPRGFVALMEHGNTEDPLLRQVLPIAAELVDTEGFNDDPVGDVDASIAPGILSKYQGRVLLIASPACAVHCRYCLRRAFPYAKQHVAKGHWQPALESLRLHTEITEVILSGGDPLSLDDARLAELIEGLGAIPHILRLRIHTRLPVLIPQRITPALLALLQNTRLTPVVVLHVNHPRELAAPTVYALKQLRQVATLLNQSVLLRGVNDDLGVLIALSTHLFDTGTLPYYIHLLDRVRGAAHFEVALPVARALLEAMRHQLPGYLVPRLAREDKGAAAKTIIL